MAMFALRLLGFGKTALDFLLRNPFALGCIVLALLWRVETHEAAKWRHHAIQADNALKQAAAASEQAKAEYERKSKEIADAADAQHAADLDAGRLALADWITRHRLHAPGPTTTPGGENGSPGVPQDPASLSGVAVSEATLNTCDQDYAYARSAFEWAQKEFGK